MTDKYAEPLIGVDRYAVVGNPIAHSKSPLIHEAFARQTGQVLNYERILAPLDDFEAMVRELIQQGYKGINITVPFKFEAFNLCTQNVLSIRALAAGAVNTLVFCDGAIITADNTDGAGLVQDIMHNLGVSFLGKKVLLLGAGGAASGVVLPLLTSRPQSLTIANRTLQNALTLREKILNLTAEITMQDWQILANEITCAEFSDLKKQSFDIIINATSTGLTDTALPIPDTIFANHCLAYDMMYGRETPFMRQARENGAQVADGLGMLVEQAAEAFYLWRGVRPETQSVMQLIRSLG